MSVRPFAVVTGASGGIGAEFARRLVSSHDVLLISRSADRLEQVRRRLAGDGRQVDVLASDLSTADGLAAVIDHLQDQGRMVDLLVNNAGSGIHGSFVSTPPAELAGLVALDVGAVVGLTRALLPAMVEAGRGGIINVGSTAGFQATPHLAVYAAAKAFVVSFSEAVAAETRGSGVTVSVIAPGTVDTGFFAAAGASFRVGGLLSAEQVVSAALHGHRKGQTLIIPGLRNKAGTFGPRLLPRRVMVKAAGWATRAR